MSNAINNSLSNLTASQKNLSIKSHNIANANDPGYSKLTMITAPSVIAGNVQGVEVVGIKTELDENLQVLVYQNIARSEYSGLIGNYLERVADTMGKPNDGRSIDYKLNEVFKAFDKLATKPDSTSLKLSAVKQLESLALSVSNKARDIEQMRFELDRDIYNSLEELNRELQNAYTLNGTISGLAKGSMERVAAEDSLRKSMEKISEYFEIATYSDSSGRTNINTSIGDPLVGDIRYFFKYSPNISTSEIIDSNTFSSILMSSYDNTGKDLNLDRPIVVGGVSTEIKNPFKSGKIGAMLNLRDVELPKYLDQLDQISKVMKDEFNKVHNKGNGYLPAQSLTGTYEVSRDTVLGFSGTVRISVLDNNGETASGVPTLDLNLGTLDTGSGAGKANLEGIVEEIKYHFGGKLTTDKSVQINDISDIKLAAVTDHFVAGNHFVLDLEVENRNSVANNIRITNAIVTDSLATTLTSSFNGATYVSNQDTKIRTGASGPSVDVTLPAAINYPLTVSLDVEVTEGATVNTNTITYIINSPTENPFNGVKNFRYSATAVSGAGATLTSPSLTTGPVEVNLLNREGYNILSTSNEAARLQIRTTSSSYRLAIDVLDSSQNGDLATGVASTKQDFNTYFGLNDLFIRTDAIEKWGDLKNSAAYFALREDIINDSNLLATAKLRKVLNSTDQSLNTDKYHVTVSDNENLREIYAIKDLNFNFATAGGMPAANVKIGEYAANLISFSNSSAYLSGSQAKQDALLKDSLVERQTSIRGVDVNEEMGQIIIIQSTYSASARVVQTARELDQILFDVFR